MTAAFSECLLKLKNKEQNTQGGYKLVNYFFTKSVLILYTCILN